MMKNLLLSRQFLNVVVHALDYYIEHADINDPLERERCAAAILIRNLFNETLSEMRKRKQFNN